MIEAKPTGGNRKCIFWQTSINYQQPNLRVHINNIVVKGLLDTGADVTIITPEYCHLIWPLQRQMFNS